MIQKLTTMISNTSWQFMKFIASIILVSIIVVILTYTPIEKCFVLNYYMYINLFMMISFIIDIMINEFEGKIIVSTQYIILCSVSLIYIRSNESNLNLDCHYAHIYYKTSFILFLIIVSILTLLLLIGIYAIVIKKKRTPTINYYPIQTERWYYDGPIIFTITILVLMIVLNNDASVKHTPILNIIGIVILCQYCILLINLICSKIINKCIDMTNLLIGKLLCMIFNVIYICATKQYQDINKAQDLYNTIIILCINYVVFFVVYKLWRLFLQKTNEDMRENEQNDTTIIV